MDLPYIPDKNEFIEAWQAFNPEASRDDATEIYDLLTNPARLNELDTALDMWAGGFERMCPKSGDLKAPSPDDFKK